MTGPSDPAPAWRPSLRESIFIVPQAHVAITRVDFQVEMYELFHRTAGARLGHMLGTLAILLGTLGLLERASGSYAPGLALFASMALWGAAVDRAVGALAALLGAGLVAFVHVAAPSLGRDLTTCALALVAGGCAVQTFSHLFEDVPPPQSGTTEFVPMARWLRAVTAREVVRSTLLTLLVFYWLELWATFRIWPLQLLHVLMRLGYRPDERRRLDARVREIIAHPTSDWRRPRAG